MPNSTEAVATQCWMSSHLTHHALNTNVISHRIHPQLSPTLPQLGKYPGAPSENEDVNVAHQHDLKGTVSPSPPSSHRTVVLPLRSRNDTTLHEPGCFHVFHSRPREPWRSADTSHSPAWRALAGTQRGWCVVSRFSTSEFSSTYLH